MAHMARRGTGFRRFGDLQARKPRVLVIGDSFTHSTWVSDDKLYYAVIQDKLDVEVFAWGAGGYSTLQEYLILDKYIDVIQPDVLLWQFCDNDFIENDLNLDEKSLDPTRLYKPYWVNGGLQYRTL